MGVRVVALVGVLAGCYSPQLERDCEVPCATGACPSGFTCEAGFCRVEGFTGACASPPIEDAHSDSNDGRTTDVMCSYTCYASSGTGSLVGSAPCQTTSNGCNPNMAWIDPIDLCSCSVGEPELYVQRVSGKLNVALVAPVLPAGHSYAMIIDNNGLCFGTGAVCPAVALEGCTASSEVDGWIQIPMPLGSTTAFRFYDDDGTGCTSAIKYTFVISL